MDLRFTPEEAAFREEVRTFIRDNLPADIRDRMKLGHSPRKEDTVRWQRILNAKGWAGLSWPKEWGGPGWTAIQKMIFLEENQVAPAPELSSFPFYASFLVSLARRAKLRLESPVRAEGHKPRRLFSTMTALDLLHR